MQFVRDIYTARHAAGRPVISFEFFPQNTDEGDHNLLEKTIPALLQTLLEIYMLHRTLDDLADHLAVQPALVRPACGGILQLPQPHPML